MRPLPPPPPGASYSVCCGGRHLLQARQSYPHSLSYPPSLLNPSISHALSSLPSFLILPGFTLHPPSLHSSLILPSHILILVSAFYDFSTSCFRTSSFLPSLFIPSSLPLHPSSLIVHLLKSLPTFPLLTLHLHPAFTLLSL